LQLWREAHPMAAAAAAEEEAVVGAAENSYFCSATNWPYSNLDSIPTICSSDNSVETI